MEAIKGSDVNVPDAVFAWMLDGRGGVKPLENTDVIDEAHPCWLHLNYVHHDSAQWLATTPLLPNNVRDALAGESTRPRVSRLGEGTLITLRCINGSTDERPDQLVAMRVYMDGRLIVSTRQRKVLALDDVVSDLEEGTGPTDCGGWLVDVCDALTDHSSEFIEQLHDKIIDLEDNLLDQQIPPRGFLALLRKQLIVMRRYMAPQRDVYARLASERLPWMSDDQRRRMQDIADRLGRGLDEIDACIARTGVMADEIAQVMQENLARRTYTMSLMAMVFLPSTFLTGLFGVNLGGIPGGGWQFGFSIFCILLVVLIVVLPVRAESKTSVPGMVHDQSSSGSTLFIEPMAVVNLNNELKELFLKEQEEIDRILADLSNRVAENANGIRQDYTVLAELDFIFAKAELAKSYNGVAPVFNEEGRINIRKGRHPLLDPKKVVPIDVRLGADFRQLIVTGPNTGGKTVSLKTVNFIKACI